MENYFHRQDATGQRNDNRTVQDFGYDGNTIKLQYSVWQVTGNVWEVLPNSMKLLQNPYQNRNNEKWHFL